VSRLVAYSCVAGGTAAFIPGVKGRIVRWLISGNGDHVSPGTDTVRLAVGIANASTPLSPSLIIDAAFGVNVGNLIELSVQMNTLKDLPVDHPIDVKTAVFVQSALQSLLLIEVS